MKKKLFVLFLSLSASLHAGGALAQDVEVDIEIVKLHPETGGILKEDDAEWETVGQTYMLIEEKYIILSDSGTLDIGGCGDVQGCRKHFTSEVRINAPKGWGLIPGSTHYTGRTGKTYFQNNPENRPTFDVASGEFAVRSPIASAWVTFGCERQGRFGGGGCDAGAELVGVAVPLN